MQFDRYVAVDWSGAEVPGRSIQVASCSESSDVSLESPQQNTYHVNWRRQDVLEFVLGLTQGRVRVLVGLDFVFALPFCDAGAYFPGKTEAPRTPSALWYTIDDVCQGASDYYGAPFFRNQSANFSSYFMYQTFKGSNYQERYRETEHCAKAQGASPKSVFKCVGAGQVGSGSIAGMRCLYHIKKLLGEMVQIWPFEKEMKARVVIVEIYPRLYRSILPQADLIRVSNIAGEPNLQDKEDALISAQALLQVAAMDEVWQLPKATAAAAKYEGWIFGVKPT